MLGSSCLSWPSIIQRQTSPYRHMNYLPHGARTADNPFGHIFALLLTARVKVEPSRADRFLTAKGP